MANSTMTLITSNTVGSGGVSSVTFSSIPSTYTDLKLIVSSRSTTTTGSVTIALNGSSTTFSGTYLQGNGAAGSSSTYTTQIALMPISTDTASTFGNFDIYFPKYTSANNKSFSVDTITENNATTAYTNFTASTWATTSAITSIALSGAFAQYSSFYLYGIKNS